MAHRSIRRIGAQQLQRLGADLSAADRGVLDELAVHRFLSTHHLHDFCYRERSDAASTRANRRTVARLTRLGLIRPVIPRRVGGVRGGAAPGVWQLTEAGHRLQSDTVRRHRVSEPGLRLLDHTLAIAETHLAVLAAAHTMNGQTDITIEDAARRTMPTVGGGQRFLRPDLAVRITASDEEGAYEDAWFIEVDCGTESITTLLAKAAAYQDYYNLGIEQHRHEGNFPLVLWVIHGHRADERLHALRSGIAARTRLADHLFRYATPATLAATLQSGGEQ